jgi:hypothetical protein
MSINSANISQNSTQPTILSYFDTPAPASVSNAKDIYARWKAIFENFKHNLDSQVNIKLKDAVAVIDQMDTNHDGVASCEEITNYLSEKTKALPDGKLPHLPPDGIQESVDLQKLRFAQQLLNSYNKVSALDKVDGISKADITKLASQQGGATFITGMDFFKLINPNDYAVVQSLSIHFDVSKAYQYQDIFNSMSL